MTSTSPALWSTIPTQVDVGSTKDAILPDSIYGTTSTSSTSSTTTVTYPNYSTPTNYSTTTGYQMYTTGATPASYYQQVASNLRAQTTFPYNLTTPSYYAAASGTYPVDYSAAYNPQQYYQRYYNPLATYSLGDIAAASSATGGNADVSAAAGFPLNMKEIKKSTKNSSKNAGSSGKKKNGSCSPGDEVYARVFIWDIDDITMLSRNIIAQVTQQFPHLASAGISLYQLIERVVAVNFSDPNELQEGDVINIEDAVIDETVIDGPIDNLRGLDIMRRVAPKYQALRQFYAEISEGFKAEKPILSYELLERCGMATQEVDLCQSAAQLQTLFNQRWQCANRCLELVTKRSAESHEKYANVVICAEGVAYAAAQLLVAGQSATIPIDNIFSTTKASKESIFEKIQSKYGKKCSFVSVTSSAETSGIAKKLAIPVWPVGASDDLEKLYTAQRNYLLG